MENRIAFRRLGRVLVRPGPARHSDEAIATIGTEMVRLGFAPAPQLLEALRSVDEDRLETTVRSLLDALAFAVGAHRAYTPFYPDFPKGVVARSEAELYLNALRHYWSGGTWRPRSPAARRPGDSALQAVFPRLRTLLGSAEVPEPVIVGLATRDEFDAIFTRLAGSATSLSSTDVADVD